MKSNSIYRIKIFSLLLFIFSLPFEYWDPFGISSYFTITKFAGFIYFGLSLFDLKNNFTLRDTKKPVVTLLSLWLFMLFQAIFNYWYGTTLSIYSFTFLQSIILFWLISNDLIRNNNLLKQIFAALIFGVFAMSLLISLGVGLDTEMDMELGSFRLTFFGSNPNSIGNLAGFSLLFITAMQLKRDKYFNKRTYFFLLFIPSIMAMLALSASRGALLITLVGVLILFLFQKTSSTRRIVTIILGFTALTFGISKILESDLMQRRISLTTTGSNKALGGRDAIWTNAIDIFYENPFFGIGNVGYQREIIRRYGEYIDTHNLFLYFMVTGGIIGFSLYLFFLSKLLLAAKKYYKNKNDALLFALLIVYLIAVIKSGGAINNKLYWILSAVIYGLGNGIGLKNSQLNS